MSVLRAHLEDDRYMEAARHNMMGPIRAEGKHEVHGILKIHIKIEPQGCLPTANSAGSQQIWP